MVLWLAKGKQQIENHIFMKKNATTLSNNSRILQSFHLGLHPVPPSSVTDSDSVSRVWIAWKPEVYPQKGMYLNWSRQKLKPASLLIKVGNKLENLQFCQPGWESSTPARNLMGRSWKSDSCRRARSVLHTSLADGESKRIHRGDLQGP